MSQYVNLAGKIKSARKSLRLTQQELATRLSEVLGRPISRGLIARWEGTSAGSRLDPSPEQLKALASLAQKPWEQFLWFVDDEIAAGRGVEYYPDGTRSADPAYSDDEVEALYAEHQRDMERLDATPPDPWLQQMIDNADAGALRNHFARLNIPEKLQGSNKIPAIEKVVIPEPRAIPRRQVTIADLGVGGVVSPPDAGVEELIEPFMGARHRAEASERAEKWIRFEPVVQWKLENDLGLEKSVKYFNPIVQFGQFKMRPDYFDGESLIEFSAMKPHYPYRFLRLQLKKVLGEFLLIEKMQRRVFKKLFLLTILESQIEGQKLDSAKILAGLNPEAEILKEFGVTLKVACGPDETAEVVARWIKTPRSEVANF